MADAPYLVALALVEFDGARAMPLTGRSQSAAAAEASDPGDAGRSLGLELLLRLLERSEAAPLRRAAGEDSLLLLELPLDVMTETLPQLKARWIANGDVSALFSGLQDLAVRAWRITAHRHAPVGYTAWPAAAGD